MPNLRTYCGCLLLSAATISGGAVSSAPAQSGYAVVYSFQNTTDGSNPYATLISDKSGNLYGTANFSGQSPNCGTAFKFAPSSNAFTTLYTFGTNNPDACDPEAGLAIDKKGNLYGTTVSQFGTGNPLGAIYKIEPSGAESVLRYFYDVTGDEQLYTPLTYSKKVLYGDSTFSGLGNYPGNGYVFKMAEDGVMTTLYQFTGGSDGGEPYSNVTTDAQGNIYGTASIGGTDGHGVVFKVAPDGTETVLYTFTGGNDGSEPAGGVVFDKAGNLYGTAALGGTNNDGTVFKLAPDGTFTVLYAFTGGNDGGIPAGPLFLSKKGDLYGTTDWYGDNDNGSVFKVAANGKETTLHTFAGGSDGSNPYDSGLVEVGGYLYGTTVNGGSSGCVGSQYSGCGTIFRVQE